MTETVYHFNTSEAARVSGFTVRQLDYWATSQMLVPSISQSNGPGTRKLYSFNDLVRLQFIKQLNEEGWSTQKIRKAIKHLNEFMSESPEYRNYRLIPDKGTILILCETKEKQLVLLDALNPGGQQMLWVVLDILRDEIRKNASQLINLNEISQHDTTSTSIRKASS